MSLQDGSGCNTDFLLLQTATVLSQWTYWYKPPQQYTQDSPSVSLPHNFSQVLMSMCHIPVLLFDVLHLFFWSDPATKSSKLFYADSNSDSAVWRIRFQMAVKWLRIFNSVGQLYLSVVELIFDNLVCNLANILLS